MTGISCDRHLANYSMQLTGLCAAADAGAGGMVLRSFDDTDRVTGNPDLIR